MTFFIFLLSLIYGQDLHLLFKIEICTMQYILHLIVVVYINIDGIRISQQPLKLIQMFILDLLRQLKG